MTDLAKAKRMLEKLNADVDVSLRDLEAALGKDGLDRYNSNWQHEIERRSYFSEKPDEIKRYEQLVHAADFDEIRANAAKPNSPRSKRDSNGYNSATRLRYQAQSKYETALTYLEEIITADSTLRQWFDRAIDFDPKISTLGIDPQQIPRTVTSTSQHKLGNAGIEKRSKADIKRDTLTAAIEHAERERDITDEERQNQNELLKQKLAQLRSGS